MNVNAPSVSPSRASVRRFRFGLRTLLLSCGLVSALFGLAASCFLTVAQVHQNVRWLEQRGAHVASNFHERYGLIPWQRNGDWRALIEWTLAKPDNVVVPYAKRPEVAGIVDKLETLPTLRRLNLAGSAVSSAEVQRLANLSHLENLLLTGTTIDDASLGSLKALRKLRSLDLSYTKVSDAALSDIAGMQSLEWVNLMKTNVSADGIQTLRRARPNLVVCPETVIDMPDVAPLAIVEPMPFIDGETKSG